MQRRHIFAKTCATRMIVEFMSFLTSRQSLQNNNSNQDDLNFSHFKALWKKYNLIKINIFFQNYCY